MQKGRQYSSVINGDIVNSSVIVNSGRSLRSCTDRIAETLGNINYDYNIWPKGQNCCSFFRGDSFQFLIEQADETLHIVLIFLSKMLSQREQRINLRLGIGIGSVDYIDRNDVTFSHGTAFLNSGKAFDSMHRWQRLVIYTPWEEKTNVLQAFCAALDHIILKWSPEQAEAVYHYLIDEKQIDIAESLGITQSAVHQRLSGAGHYAVRETINCSRIIFQ